MSTILSAEQRALAVMRRCGYVALATEDENGPWVAALSYVPFAPSYLFFVSLIDSRHAQAVSAQPQIAGLIFDSRAGLEEVESVQFSGRCEMVDSEDEVVAQVLERSARILGTEQPTIEMAAAFRSDSRHRVYRVEIEQAFVLDQQAWEERQEDARQAVDMARVLVELEGDIKPR